MTTGRTGFASLSRAAARVERSTPEADGWDAPVKTSRIDA